jgi:protein gp37
LTWNPIAGCSLASPGCTNCYAMQQAARIERMNPDIEHYRGVTRTVNGNAVWTGKLGFSEKKLVEPLKRKKPTTYFVNSMSDLFHESMPDEWIDRVFAVMALCPQHQFQVLTKRSARMREYCSTRRSDTVYPQMSVIRGVEGDHDLRIDWPLPNVWLGVSAEDQKRADERIPDLRATPAAVRFVSLEPLLGPIELGDAPANLDWVIVGSESGPGARPCDLDWVRAIRDRCTSACVAFFWKQHVINHRKIATPELDGRRWKEFPAVSA